MINNHQILLLILTTIISVAHYIVRRWDTPEIKYPDAIRYLSGARLHKPFHLRWLMPFLFRGNQRTWRVVNMVALVSLSPLIMLYLESLGLSSMKSFLGSLLVPGLPGIFRMATICPYLVDTVACALIVGSATLLNMGYYIPGIALAIIAACVKESSPAFIAVFAQSALPLIGFVAVAIRQIFWKSNPNDMFDAQSKDILDHPYLWGKRCHQGRWFSADIMLLPWGVCMAGFAGFLHPQMWWCVLAIAMAYGQTLFATDSIRLYQYAFPALIYGTVLFLPEAWFPLAIIGHWFNPYQKNCL